MEITWLESIPQLLLFLGTQGTNILALIKFAVSSLSTVHVISHKLGVSGVKVCDFVDVCGGFLWGCLSTVGTPARWK
jgi:3-oxoacyl-[acyl-carrier-protein] synthase III